jgi:hypothetical protein
LAASSSSRTKPEQRRVRAELACGAAHGLERAALRLVVFEEAAVLLPRDVDEHVQAGLGGLVEQPARGDVVDAHGVPAELRDLVEVTADPVARGQEQPGVVGRERAVADPAHEPLLGARAKELAVDAHGLQRATVRSNERGRERLAAVRREPDAPRGLVLYRGRKLPLEHAQVSPNHDTPSPHRRVAQVRARAPARARASQARARAIPSHGTRRTPRQPGAARTPHRSVRR